MTTRRRGLRRRLGLVRAPDSDGDAELSPSDKPRKGVTYTRDGAVVCCRFCEILRAGDADFVYEDDSIAVFRPLAPVVESHVLVVPRCHIRNINQLTRDHAALLQRMRAVAELVLLGRSADADGRPVACKFAFHKPPFNSIDHVHMHAFRTDGDNGAVGYFGAIKYRTETWWCRSFEEVLSRVATASTATSTPSSSSSSLSSSHSSSASPDDCKENVLPGSLSSSLQERSNTMSEPWRIGDQRPRATV